MRTFIFTLTIAAIAALICQIPDSNALAAGYRPDGQWAPLDGVIHPFETIEVGSPSSGVLIEVIALRGEHVSAGQVLAKLDSEVEKQSAELARLASLSEADLRSARIKLDSAKLKLSTRQVLAEDGYLAEEELNSAIAEQALAELEVAAALEQAAIAKVEYKKAQAIVARTMITAPADSIVVERHSAPGEVVSSSPDAIVFTLARLDPLIVEVRAPVAWLRDLEVGDVAVVTPTFDETLKLNATLRVIDAVADAASETVRLRFELPNPDLALPAGVRCRVALTH